MHLITSVESQSAKRTITNEPTLNWLAGCGATVTLTPAAGRLAGDWLAIGANLLYTWQR
jgi:hypothetical protein